MRPAWDGLLLAMPTVAAVSAPEPALGPMRELVQGPARGPVFVAALARLLVCSRVFRSLAVAGSVT